MKHKWSTQQGLSYTKMQARMIFDLRPCRHRVIPIIVVSVLSGMSVNVAAQDRVASTVHNLAASGPGTIRAQSEQQICIFCHAPHNTSGVRPLWNREMPATMYQIYSSSTLDANPGQPTGSSKLCLSCHDGTIALGSVLSRAEQIQMSGGSFLPAGLTNLGTDLSDDHPISFTYTTGLAAADLQLVSPSALPSTVKLDASSQLQCTSCHDPHHNRYGDFLVMSNEFSALCVSCHMMNGWSGCSHRVSNVAVSGNTSVVWPYDTVAANGCRSCHTPHTAGGRERLQIAAADEDNCLACHSGTVASANILTEIDKYSAHDPRRYDGIHDAAENLASQQDHVECADCHNPHAVSAPTQTGGYVSIGATLIMSSGVSQGGSEITQAQNEYEVCYRCHADNAVNVRRRISRQADTTNLRLKFGSGSPSYHPVVTPVGSTDTVSLVPGLAQGSMIRCTDCHNNDNGPRAGGTGPDGPHGSINDYLLERNYTVRDDTQESVNEYAMCYKCHERSSILSNDSFKEHKKHIEGEKAPCSACHDPHGINSLSTDASDHTHLINFDPTIVLPLPGRGPTVFRDLGRFAGSCTLTCHGEDHDNKSYGPGGGG